MDITVRPIEEQEVKDFFSAAVQTFGEAPRDDDLARYSRVHEIDRSIAAVEGDAIIGTTGAFSFRLTVPGGEVDAAGVTIVSVLPSHRRRGALTKMMRHQLDDVRRRGEPVAILWASEGAIYQRFGYGMASVGAAMEVERDRASFIQPSPVGGTTRLLSAEEALLVLPEIYDRERAVTPGMYRRSEEWWDAHSLADPEHHRDGGGPLLRAVWELDGRPGAYVLCRMHPQWGDDGVPSGHVSVKELIATSPLATREIWRFVFGIDLVARIKAWNQPVDDPIFHMLGEPRRLRPMLHDNLWLRIVEVRSSLLSRRYSAEGTITFELTDSFCPYNEGIYELEAKDGEARLEDASGAPELSLSASDLGACYLGGTTFTQLVRAGRVLEHAAGAAERADTLFRSERAPWCPEDF
jgi:predicted acetyltransferase